MRVRPSARLLVLNSSDEVLLFRFAHTNGALAGQEYWATPGGGVEDNETFEQAAVRELKEETGICADVIGCEIGQRKFVLQLPSGEDVEAHERYFLVRVDQALVAHDGLTAHEAEVMAHHKWWSLRELEQASETVWPDNLLTMLEVAVARSLAIADSSS